MVISLGKREASQLWKGMQPREPAEISGDEMSVVGRDGVDAKVSLTKPTPFLRLEETRFRTVVAEGLSP